MAMTGPKFDSRLWSAQAAFELAAEPMFQQYLGHAGSSCMGAMGAGTLKLTMASAPVIRIDGCELFGFPANYSGDALSYVPGPRWSLFSTGGWKLYVQLLGDTKVSHEYADLARKNEVIQLALLAHQPRPERIHCRGVRCGRLRLQERFATAGRRLRLTSVPGSKGYRE